MEKSVEFCSQDYWFRVIAMLQQHWALIEPEDTGGARIYFLSDDNYVFDQMPFASAEQAAEELSHFGFRRYAGDEEAQKFLRPPDPPFCLYEPYEPFYSAGKNWED